MTSTLEKHLAAHFAADSDTKGVVAAADRLISAAEAGEVNAVDAAMSEEFYCLLVAAYLTKGDICAARCCTRRMAALHPVAGPVATALVALIKSLATGDDKAAVLAARNAAKAAATAGVHSAAVAKHLPAAVIARLATSFAAAYCDGTVGIAAKQAAVTPEEVAESLALISPGVVTIAAADEDSGACALDSRRMSLASSTSAGLSAVNLSTLAEVAALLSQRVE